MDEELRIRDEKPKLMQPSLTDIETRNQRHRDLLARKVGRVISPATFAVALRESTTDVQKLVVQARALVKALGDSLSWMRHLLCWTDDTGEWTGAGINLYLLKENIVETDAALAPFEDVLLLMEVGRCLST